MPRRTVAIVGFSVRAIAQSAVRAGARPWSCDAFADRDLRACGPCEICSDYPYGLVDRLAAAKLPRDTPVVYGGGLENHPDVVAQLERLHPLWGNPPSSLTCRDHDFFSSSASSPGDARRVRVLAPPATPQGDRRVLIKKPRYGSGGLDIRLVLPSDHMLNDSRFDEFRIQPYVPGPSFGALFVMGAGRAWLWGVTRQRTGRRGDDLEPPSDFTYAGSLGPWPVRPSWRQTLSSLGERLARRYALRGLCGIDFIGGLRPWPIEVNPRWTASAEILERATGASAWDLHAIGCTATNGDEFERRIAQAVSPSSRNLNESNDASRRDSPTSAWFGKAIWYADQQTIVADSMLAALDAIGVYDPQSSSGRAVEVADVPAGSQVIPAEAPICTVLAAGATPACVERQLRRTIESLRRTSLRSAFDP